MYPVPNYSLRAHIGEIPRAADSSETTELAPFLLVVSGLRKLKADANNSVVAGSEERLDVSHTQHIPRHRRINIASNRDAGILPCKTRGKLLELN